MIDDRLFWIWLTELSSIGPVTQRKLLNRFGSPFKVYQSGIKEMIEIEGIGEKIAHNVSSQRLLDRAEQILRNCQLLNVGILTMNQEEFPMNLRKIYNAPVLLYYQGQLRKIDKSVLVTGDFEPDRYGKKATQLVVQSLIHKGVTLVAGLSNGIEAKAHKAAIESDGYTVALLGNGIDVSFPSSQSKLRRQIAKEGLLLSPYPPGTKVYKSQLVKRLKWMGQMVDCIVVVQASTDSVSLKTARWAKEEGKEVQVVPNGIFSKVGNGSNRLLAEGYPVWKLSIEKNNDTKFIGSDLKRRILKMLQEQDYPVDIIKKRMGHNHIENELIELELEGRVVSIAGVIRKI